MSKLKLLLIIVTSFCSIQCAPEKGETEKVNVKILFIGNSLTYTNNLPELVKIEGKRNNMDITAHTIAHPNYALEDHWIDEQIQQEIASGQYDFVVVQQGPSSQADGRAMLLEYGSLIKKLCDEHHAKLAYFMVWPAKANYHMFPGVIANYTEAAQQTNSILCPVGAIWKAQLDATNDFSYYGADGFHPSLKGSQSAAEIIVKHLFNK